MLERGKTNAPAFMLSYLEAVRVVMARAQASQRIASGASALHTAACAGYLQVVRVLLEWGDAEVNAQDEEGATALHYAALEGHVAIVEELIRNGAHVNQGMRMKNIQKQKRTE